MKRITEPLGRMGATILARSGERLPLLIEGTRELVPVDYRSHVASAQVKSAVMLAGLHTLGTTSVMEPSPSRDHSERMLQAMGADIAIDNTEDGRRVSVGGRPELNPLVLSVPGDPSSAAFPMAAAAALPGSAVRIERVGINPLRTGLLRTLREMSASIEVIDEIDSAGEPVADLLVGGGQLKAVDVPADRAPSMIDEYPILAVAAATADGTTRMRGLGELRVKESDRLTVMAEGLSLCGVDVRIDGDDLIITGGRVRGGVTIDAELDHRIAMSFAVLGAFAEEPITVTGASAIATSFPDFVPLMRDLGLALTEREDEIA